MSGIEIEGVDDLLAALDAEMARIETGAENAVAQAVEGTFEDSQKAVPYDAVTRHESGYVHLRDSAEKDVQGLEGSLTYGTDHAEYVEFGTSRMVAQPYLGPAFETNSKKFVQACEDLVQ